MRLIQVICALSILLACNQDYKSDNNLNDFINGDRTISSNLSEIPNGELIDHFDTIPIEFGKIIFDDILQSLDSSTNFRRVWETNYQHTDSIENVLALKTNKFLDPENQLSKNSYFMIVVLRETPEIAIAAAIYLDLDSDNIGTFIKVDSLDSFVFEQPATVYNLKQKFKI